MSKERNCTIDENINRIEQRDLSAYRWLWPLWDESDYERFEKFHDLWERLIEYRK